MSGHRKKASHRRTPRGPGPPRGIGEAPGKILLFGEHAVVYGEPALGFPISRRVRAEIRPGEGQLHVRLPPEFAVEASPGCASPEALVQKALGSTRSNVEVTLDLGVPPMRGLGSSAAVAIALLRARAGWNQRPPPGPQRLVEGALAVETVAHARPSGVDPAISAYGQLVRFVLRDGRRAIRRVRVEHPAFFVVGSVGSHGGTAASVSRIAALRTEDRRLMRAAMAALGEATHAGQRGLLNGDLERVGRAMDLAHGVLGGLALVSPRVDQAVVAARGAGALGAKMSGAGGAGGAFVAVYASSTAARRAARHLAQAHASDGIHVWVESLGEPDRIVRTRTPRNSLRAGAV